MHEQEVEPIDEANMLQEGRPLFYETKITSEHFVDLINSKTVLSQMKQNLVLLWISSFLSETHRAIYSHAHYLCLKNQGKCERVQLACWSQAEDLVNELIQGSLLTQSQTQSQILPNSEFIDYLPMVIEQMKIQIKQYVDPSQMYTMQKGFMEDQLCQNCGFQIDQSKKTQADRNPREQNSQLSQHYQNIDSDASLSPEPCQCAFLVEEQQQIRTTYQKRLLYSEINKIMSIIEWKLHQIDKLQKNIAVLQQKCHASTNAHLSISYYQLMGQLYGQIQENSSDDFDAPNAGRLQYDDDHLQMAKVAIVEGGWMRVSGVSGGQEIGCDS